MNRTTKIILGVVLTLGVVGGIYYFYKKSKKNAPITPQQKSNREILIYNTDK